VAESVNAAEFTAFAAKLKGAERGVRTRVRKALREAARPLAAEVVPEGAEGLPGGLAAHVVATGGRAIISQTATGVRVILGKRKGPQIGRMDEGNLRHPTYGHKPWVAQDIPAGTFTAALEKRLPDMRDKVAAELQHLMGELG
jgi:hypothetical protein